MTIDFAALTASVGAGLGDIRACLVVSRDGLPLGAYPRNEEARALNVWTRIAALGDADRGFVASSQELWAFCRLGPYRALAVAAPTAAPGIVLDRLDSMLRTAEEVRREGLIVQQSALEVPEWPSVPSIVDEVPARGTAPPA